MATWYDVYWSSLKAVIETTWPEVPAGSLFTGTALERVDWINALNNGQLSGPWCVVQIDIAPTDGWGAGAPRFLVSSKVHYICPTSASKASGQTIQEYLMSKLIALQLQFYAASGIGTVLTEMPIDISAESEINRGLLDAKLFFQSGSVAPTSVVIGLSESNTTP